VSDILNVIILKIYFMSFQSGVEFLPCDKITKLFHDWAIACAFVCYQEHAVCEILNWLNLIVCLLKNNLDIIYCILQVHGSLELLALLVIAFELGMKVKWLGVRMFVCHIRTMIKVLESCNFLNYNLPLLFSLFTVLSFLYSFLPHCM